MEMYKISPPVKDLYHLLNKPSATTSNDAFVRQSINQMDCNRPIINYLECMTLHGDSIRRKGSASNHDKGTLRRPLPLHKRPNLLLRDILQVKTRTEKSAVKETTDKAFNGRDDDQISATEPPKIYSDSEDRMDVTTVKSDRDPVVIPCVSILSSDEESECEIVRFTANDSIDTVKVDEVKETKKDEGKQHKFHRSGLNDINSGSSQDNQDSEGMAHPELIKRQSAIEPSSYTFDADVRTIRTALTPSTLKGRSKPSSASNSDHQKNRLRMVVSPPVIKGRLERDITAGGLYSTSTVDMSCECLDKLDSGRQLSKRMMTTWNYFDELEAKQTFWRKKNAVNIKQGSVTGSEEVGSNDAKLRSKNSSKEEKNTNQTSSSKKGPGNEKGHVKNRKANTKFVQYVSGSEVHSKKLIPKKCDINLEAALSGTKRLNINLPHGGCQNFTTSKRESRSDNLIDRRMSHGAYRTSSQPRTTSAPVRKIERTSSQNGSTDATNDSAVKIFNLSKRIGPKKRKATIRRMNKPVITMVKLANTDAMVNSEIVSAR